MRNSITVLFFLLSSIFCFSQSYNFSSKAHKLIWQGSVIKNGTVDRTKNVKLPFNHIPSKNGGVAYIGGRELEDGTRPKSIFSMHPKKEKNGTVFGSANLKLGANAKISGAYGFAKPNPYFDTSPFQTDGARFMITLKYRPNRGTSGRSGKKVLLARHKRNTGQLIPFNIDLSAYKNHLVIIEIRVDAGNTAKHDNAVWKDLKVTWNDDNSNTNDGSVTNVFDNSLNGKTFFIQSKDKNLNESSRFIEVSARNNINSNIKIESFSSGFENKFVFESAGNGYYFIKNKSFFSVKRYLTVKKGDKSNKANGYVRTEPLTKSDRQKWKVIKRSDGFYMIISKFRDLVLTDEGTSFFSKKHKAIRVRNFTAHKDIRLWKLIPDKSSFTYRKEYKIKDIKNLCPTRRISGDGEFAGNGPIVYGDIDIVKSRTGLDAIIKFNARETKSDWSHVQGEWVKNVVSIPNSSFRINKILTPNRKSTYRYNTRGGMPKHGFQFSDGGKGSGTLTMQKNGFVKSMRFIGDTGGNDISDDNNCQDDTRVTFIQFKPILLEITKLR